MKLTERPVLIIVQGMPGAGKTTLARRLGADLELPQISKDDLKEFLFDKVGTGDRDWSRMLGRAVSQMLYPLVESFLEHGQSLVLESAFYRDLAVNELQTITKRYQAHSLEIYCRLEETERRRRFIARNESGERHKGHLDEHNYQDVNEAITNQTYAPLRIGPLLEIDTLHFGEKEYNELRQKVMSYMKEGIS